MMKATAMVVIQDLVRTIIMKMVLVMLLIITEMIEMIITIIIAIKSGEVSDNSMPTICMTQTLSSPCGQNQMTSGSTAAICLSNSTLLLPPPLPQAFQQSR